MSLQEQITARAREIRTDGYGMSIGEVLSLYRDQDIDIHPEFQRIFRWKDAQKSKLIESILLGIPIPPIFVSQRSDGVWDVIDGVQRLSTILEFVGEYMDEDGNKQPPLRLNAGEYLTELEGYRYDQAGSAADSVFDDSLRRDFKRAKLDFRIITKESDDSAKYDLFQRLNSGSVLSPQEARNCLMVMIDRKMYQTVVSLADREDFRACVPLSERQEEQAYRQELVLRFFCQEDFHGTSTELPKEYGEFLTDWMRKAADVPGWGMDVELFDRTFKLLAESLSEDSFRRWDGNRHLGPFSISSFEFVTTGVAANVDTWEGRSSEDLEGRINEMWDEPAFRTNSGTGISPRRRVPKLINESRTFFGV
ncbi:DUF262 domain-containing protein [Nocardioides sp. InS609-2]|uniref:DUF262 domain-containing protein n=1 Tax=Nocardioides sp. InS609-2 TaxID=2760705 RepID=UPI0020BDC517|nr:DUF262 domain-containing protein [Nocardioides sp. InS609-2]